MRNVVSVSIIMLGSGAADGVPSAACLIKPRKGCQACKAALYDGRNIRGQTCTLYQIFYDDGQHHNVLIDCGPALAAAAAKYFTEHGIDRLDAILLTHEHADATAGIPFLRQWKEVQDSLVVYTSQECATEVTRQFPFAWDSFNNAGQSAQGAGVSLRVIPDNGSFTLLDSFVVNTFQVQHGMRKGKPFMSLGFHLPLANLYISDIQKLPVEAEERIRSLLGDHPASVMLIDGYTTTSTTTHLTIYQAACIAEKLGVKKSYLTQINDGPSHATLIRMCQQFEDQSYLSARNKADQANPPPNDFQTVPPRPCWIRPGYDGMVIRITKEYNDSLRILDAAGDMATIASFPFPPTVQGHPSRPQPTRTLSPLSIYSSSANGTTNAGFWLAPDGTLQRVGQG